MEENNTPITPPAGNEPPATPPAGNEPPANTPPSTEGNPPPATGGNEPPLSESNPLLQDPPKEGNEGKEGDPAANNPAPMSDEDYAKGITVDEGAEYTLDSDAVKAMVPHLKEAGLNAEQSKKIANELAKYQYETMKAEAEARQARIREWKPQVEAMIRENPNIQAEWQAAMNEIAKYDPILVDVIRNTELGYSPGMLRALSLCGRPLVGDGGIGTQATGGGMSNGKGYAAIMSNGIYK
jgi:hypothetical protein